MLLSGVNSQYRFKQRLLLEIVNNACEYNNEIKNNPAIRNLIASPLTIYQYQLKKLSYGFCINKRNVHVKSYINQLNQAIDKLADQD